MRKAKLLAMLQLTVRGIPCMYYGEEIGMTNLPQPFATALDPIPHKFKSIPRFLFDMLGLTINRDEVRTPMQWDTSRNAGFSSSEGTWLPVHDNYRIINAKTESDEKKSLLNTIRSLMKIRNEQRALQEGSLQLLQDLPIGVLGYKRTLENTSSFVFLNFSHRKNEFQFKVSRAIFHLSESDQITDQIVQLGPFGGLILQEK
jgi:glucan 1,6-alpha-glucosidase